MTVPSFETNGWLPAGIHEATLSEVKTIFGRSIGSECRSIIMERLLQYIDEAKKCRSVKYLIINGSFISNNPLPNDVDILVVMPNQSFDDVTLSATEVNVVDRQWIKRQYKFIHAFPVIEGDIGYEKMLNDFGHIKNSIIPKGVLKIQL